ncbi:glycosyltransferase family 2 protein [Chryseobacterium sp. MP_3.2]|uniref:glycosyltransferase family 2 protein n=1 Tax=Chryseobacterium sp. MP_3.2 TaxID=3071712 RepID=UPI002E0171AD|nr:glycosyltransferase involved in cell wall biosynthesis [Chryseobacterium sp. MP_3.2]
MFRLAIIIPYYKINFFRETLTSLEKQTCKEFSLYIGNDCSRDDPLDLIKEILKTTPYKYQRFQDNLGGKNLVQQWERVITHAKPDEWFMILGDDDVLSKNFVEEFYKILDKANKQNCNVIRFGQRWIDETNEILSPLTQYPELIAPADHIHWKIIDKKKSSLSEHVFRKSAYEKFKFRNFPLAWNSDDMAIFECSGGNPIIFSSSAYVNVHVTSESISGKSDNSDQKLLSKKQFEKILLSKYHRQLRKDTVRQLANEHIYFLQHHKTPLNFNLLKIFIYTGDIKKLLQIPILYALSAKILLQSFIRNEMTNKR